MPQNKKLIQLGISALMALLFVNFYLRGKEQNIENNYGMIEVLAASRDIPPYTLLNESYLSIKQVPFKFMEPGAIIVKIPDQAYQRVVGKITMTGIPADAQITQANLKNPDGKVSGVAPLLPPGKRGYLLRLGNLDVAELILPGNYIDVMATFSIKDKDSSTKETFTILQNILVMAVGRELRKPDQDVTSKKDTAAESLVLTLAVDPTEAERLSLAQSESQGEISVVVRAVGDNTVRSIPGVTPAKLLN